MKRRFLVVRWLVIISSISFLPIGCTTDQRGGRTAGQYMDDKSLSGRVKAALNESPDYKFTDVHVESMRGSVQLSGFVGTSAQKSTAGEIAKSVRGVQNVDNKISVR